MKNDSMLKKALNIVLSVFIAITFILSALSVLYISVFTNKETILKKCLVDSYYDSVYTSAQKALIKATTSVVAVDKDKILGTLDENRIKELAKEYMTGCVSCIVDNTGAPQINGYESDEMREIVISGISENVKSNGLKISDEQLKTDGEGAYKLLVGYVDASISFLPSVVSNLMVRVGELVARTAFLSKAPVILITAFALLLIAKVIINRKNGFADVMYKTASPLWISAITVFIPFAVLSAYNLPSKIAVDPSSSIYFFAVGIINSILHNGFLIMLFVTIALTVYLAVSIIMLVRRTEPKKESSGNEYGKKKKAEYIAQ